MVLFLTNLRSVFESGYDLREKEKELALKTQKYTWYNEKVIGVKDDAEDYGFFDIQ